jgi:threonine dehydrogenase-like Zn-dependent dehydrogenase
LKAIAYTMPGIALIDIPEPKIEKAGQVKIKISYASICGSDIHTVKGEADGHFQELGYQAGQPIVIGHEASGIIVAIAAGQNDKGLKVGDKVTFYYNHHCGNCYFCRNGQEQFCLNMKTNDSAMTEYLVLNQQQVYRLPDDTDLAKACIIEPISVCLHGIDLCRIRPGNKVAISGGGGVGLLLLQLAKLSGASRLTLIEPMAEKRAMALRLGAQFVIDPTVVNVKKQAMKLTANLGYDVVIETSGSRKAVQPAYDIASRGATVELFAIYGDYKFEVDLLDMWQRELRLQTVFQSPYMFPRAIALFDHLDLDDYVKAIYPPEQFQQAFDTHMSGQAVKVMFKFA